jgi:hypothetical protein
MEKQSINRDIKGLFMEVLLSVEADQSVLALATHWK